MTQQKKGSDTFTIRIPDKLRDTMLKRCQKDNNTPSALIRRAIGLYLLGRDCEDEKNNVLKDDPKV